MSVDVVLALLSLMALGNYWLNRSVLYPPFLFCCMWLLDLSLYRLKLIETDPLHSDTLLLIALGGLLFTFGGILALLCPRNLIATRLVLTRFPARNKIVKPLIILFLFCGLPLLFRTLLGMASAGVGDTIFQRARTGGVTAEGVAGVSPLLAYFVLWPYYAAPLFMIERRDKSFWAMALIAFVAGLLSTGRLPVLMLASALTSVYLMTTNRHTLWAATKLARIPIILFFCFYCAQIFLNKDTSIYEGGVIGIIVFFLVSYIIGPTAALDYFLRHRNDYADMPHHTFKFFLGVAAKLHLAPLPAQVGYKDFVLVPYPINVYTIYQTYISDFGFYGALVSITLIGLCQTLLYRKARTGSELGIYFFAITLFAVFMAPFSDEYSAFGSYIDALLFAGIYIVLRSIPLRILPKLNAGYSAELEPASRV